MKVLLNQKGQALLFITTLLMLLSLLGIASLNLVKTEKLVVNDSVEETQAYNVAEGAVEKVFALVKENSGILDQFTLNKTYGKTELNSLKNLLNEQNLATVESLLGLFNQPYAALEIFQVSGEALVPRQYTRTGTIYAIALTKTATNSSGCTLRIEATGKYGLATRTLVVHAKAARPLQSINGVVVQNPPSFAHASELGVPLTILNGGNFTPKGRFMHSVYINGDCHLQEDTSLVAQAPWLVNGNVTITSGALVEGQVQATGEVLLEEGVLGEPVVNGHKFLNLTFPVFPDIDRAWLQHNCDYYYPGDQILRAEDLQQGIHYVAGNVTINGNYQGNITLAASGSITIPHSALLKGQGQDSLLLLGFGGVQVEDQAQLTALVYTPTAMEVGYQAQFSGVLACRNLHSNGAIFIENTVIKQVHPTWHITQIKILSWQEKYPVFRIN